MRDVRFMAWASLLASYTDFPIVVQPWLDHAIDLVGAQVRLLSGSSPAMHICNSYRPNIMEMSSGQTRIDWCPRSDAVLPFPAVGTVAHFDFHAEPPWVGSLFALYTVAYADAVEP